MTITRTCAKAPCKSCPYRHDVPSGVWAKSEYRKLPEYDGDVPEQLMKGAVGVFDCHQRDGNMCAGWIATHGAKNLLALRLAPAGSIARAVYAYQSPVPVFASGEEAAKHGMREIKRPKDAARKMVERLTRKREREGGW